MNRRRLLTVVTLLATVPLAAAALPVQNPFAARPTKEHALLEKLVGTWTAKFTLTIPGAPSMVSTGTEVNEMLGQLWVTGRYDDPGMMGGQFSGAGLTGYDPDKEKYVSAWVDNQSTSLTVQEGTYDEATRTLTLSGPSVDPMTGQEGIARSVMHWSDDDHRAQTLFVAGPGDEEMQMFRIEYVRVK